MESLTQKQTLKKWFNSYKNLDLKKELDLHKLKVETKPSKFTIKDKRRLKKLDTLGDDYSRLCITVCEEIIKERLNEEKRVHVCNND